VQDERQPLGGSQGLEHHEQREPDGVGQERFLLRIGLVFAADDRVGDVHLEGLLAAVGAGAEHVQADA
jgi:hypothetical protein